MVDFEGLSFTPGSWVFPSGEQIYSIGRVIILVNEQTLSTSARWHENLAMVAGTADRARQLCRNERAVLNAVTRNNAVTKSSPTERRRRRRSSRLAGLHFTATATDANGNTSEFSPCSSPLLRLQSLH
jgi:hypothetical protein